MRANARVLTSRDIFLQNPSPDNTDNYPVSLVTSRYVTFAFKPTRTPRQITLHCLELNIRTEVYFCAKTVKYGEQSIMYML